VVGLGIDAPDLDHSVPSAIHVFPFFLVYALQSRYAATKPVVAALPALFRGATERLCSTSKNVYFLNIHRICSGVALQNRLGGGKS
jgi:hypothetical protein